MAVSIICVWLKQNSAIILNFPAKMAAPIICGWLKQNSHYFKFSRQDGGFHYMQLT